MGVVPTSQYAVEGPVVHRSAFMLQVMTSRSYLQLMRQQPVLAIQTCYVADYSAIRLTDCN
jgi:hypothetical protein